ncbi:MAG: hypothetical protein BWY06_02601 [Candidatus Latescibacteria bacterium ADurb.Bin168]|nr:MAG: hypothetical protein BWY06_02601 [Candidatus Latescibacteria bacterium ADurb.Bin168]
MVATVFFACGAHTARIELDPAVEHFLDAVKRAGVVILRGFVRAFLDDVAHGNDFRQRVVHVDARVGVADTAHADDTDFECHDSFLCERRILKNQTQDSFPERRHTEVNHPWRSATVPSRIPNSASWISFVTGPLFPDPIGTLSIVAMGVISAAVPVKNTSSAM